MARHRIKNGVSVPLTAEEEAHEDAKEAAYDAPAAVAARKTEVTQKARFYEYPAIGDQLDVFWKQMTVDKANGKTLEPETEAMLAKITKVKTENPLE